MINEKQAIELAVKKGLTVSKVKKTKMPELDFYGKNIINSEIKVGNAVCFHSTNLGGSGSWRVFVDGVEILRQDGSKYSFYKGQAIEKAVEIQ
jgi:hypothetical protein